MNIVNVEKRLIDKLVDECNENIDEEIETVSEGKDKFNSCILYIALFSMFFIINVGIGAYFVYCKYINHNKEIFLNIIIMFIKKKKVNINGRN